MKFNSNRLATLFVVWAAYGIVIRSAEPDPYEPLRLYDGTWQVRMGGTDKKPDILVDHCVRTGKFYSCEQEFNGKTRALVVFLPAGTTSTGAMEYSTLVARADLTKPDDWEHLAIEGDTWTFTWMEKEGEKIVSMRNVNRFSGRDHIHFEVQKLEEGGNWKAQLAGDEDRVK